MNDNDLVLIGIGEAGYGFREPTRDELESYEASKALEAFTLDPMKLRKANADKARLDQLTN